MMRKINFRILVNSILLTLLLVGFASPARAFDGRGGESITIAAADTINDSLYVSAKIFLSDGTIKGDLFVVGETITINGTVDGDVMAAGQTVIINGVVTGDVRIAGGALFIGEKASIAGDLLAFGASLETRKGSTTGKDAIFFGGQALLAGDIGRNVNAATGGLKIEGNIGGDVKAEVGDAGNAGPNPSVYLPQVRISLPNVPAGLNIDPAVKIGGKIIYTSAQEISLPANIAAGGIQHLKPVIQPEDVVETPTLPEQIMTETFGALRRMITLILFGLLLVWLFPTFLKRASTHIQNETLPMLGWGVVAWAAFFFAVLVLIVATIIGAAIFGALTLNSISGIIIWLGSLSLLAISIGFFLATAHLAQIIVSILAGQLILARIKPEWSEHKTWPLITGVVLFAILSAIPMLGWVINLIAILLGLGALWVMGRDAIKLQQMNQTQAV